MNDIPDLLGHPENIYSSGFMCVGGPTSKFLVGTRIFDEEVCIAISGVGSGSRRERLPPPLAAYISASFIDAQLFAVFFVTVILTYLALISGKS